MTMLAITGVSIAPGEIDDCVKPPMSTAASPITWGSEK